MRTSPSIAPHGPEQDTYLVLDDFGPTFTARASRRTDENAADRETVIRNLLAGEYSSPARIVRFKGWCRDATKDLADEVRRRYPETYEMSESVLAFLDARYVDGYSAQQWCPQKDKWPQNPPGQRRPLPRNQPIGDGRPMSKVQEAQSAEIGLAESVKTPFRNEHTKSEQSLSRLDFYKGLSRCLISVNALPRPRAMVSFDNKGVER